MLEVILDNRNGNLWDLTSMITDVSWKTSRVGKPSTLGFSFIKGSPFEDDRFKLEPGDIVRVHKDGKGVFYGYVFAVNSGVDEKVTVTAYDQIRYLQANDTYVFKNATATEVIRRIANDFELKTGTLAQTAHIIPSMVEDDKKLLDIICKALDYTLVGEKKIYTFYDEFGELTLRNSEDMLLEFWVGDGSLMTGYEYNRSIDNETYNLVKVVQDNKKTGKRDLYVEKDSATISRWGLLQYYKKAEEGMNPAQIKELAKNLLTLNNRERKTMSLEAIGDLRVRAGCYLRIYVEEFGINQPFLVEECSHEQLEENESIMKLELKVI